MAQKNSLDNLMMTFADLSASNKGSSFKGPALKDVKIQTKSKTKNSPTKLPCNHGTDTPVILALYHLN